MDTPFTANWQLSIAVPTAEVLIWAPEAKTSILIGCGYEPLFGASVWQQASPKARVTKAWVSVPALQANPYCPWRSWSLTMHPLTMPALTRSTSFMSPARSAEILGCHVGHVSQHNMRRQYLRTFLCFFNGNVCMCQLVLSRSACPLVIHLHGNLLWACILPTQRLQRHRDNECQDVKVGPLEVGETRTMKIGLVCSNYADPPSWQVSFLCLVLHFVARLC